MSAQWDALWKPRDSSSTWHAEWSVPVSPSTRLLDPEYDGSSRHRAARVAPKPLDAAALPQDFELGVVFGPSGSGKSSLLQDLAEHYGLAAARRDAFEFPASMAVCSHAGLRGEGIDRLSCVGLNRVPSWLKPAQVLSDGERQRVLCALSLETGAILDDFAVVVDERNAASMAASLSKFVRGRGLRRVLVSTTKRCVLPFLAPDFVLFTLSGCVKLNPFPLEQRRVTLTISSDVLGFSGGKGGGWQGPADDATLEAKKDIGAGQARSPGKVLGGTVPQTLSVSVDADDSCHQAANAFDFDFDGRSEQVVHVLNAEALHQATGGGHWSLGAVVGPSGTGKSHNMRQLVGRGGGQALLSWDDRAVIDHLHADPEQARALAAAVALPVAAALRPWAVLSTGERARAEVARRLGTAGSGCPLCLDEFTSCLDRTTARQVCWGVACYIRSAVPPVQVVVATVHEDILGWLLPDWVLESRCGTVTVMSGPEPTVGTLDAVHRMRTLRPNLSATSGADVEELRELLKPPTLSFSLSRLDGCAESRRVYCELFEEHHYLKGSSPMCLYGLLLRETTSNQPVAFHGVALKVGVGCTNMTLRESRLVVLPDFQGFGLGPKLSNYVGGLLTKSGADLYAVTAHPRLGAYRQMHPELWRPTCMNLKASKGTMAASLRKTRAKERGDKLAVAADVGDAAAPRPRVCFSHRFVRAATLEKPAAAELALDASPASQCSTRAPQTPGDSLSATQASQESGPSATDSGENFESAWRARQSKASIARKSPAPKHHIKGAARKDTPLSAALAGCLACRREAMIAQKMPLPRGRPPRHTCGGSPRPKQKVTAADADDAAAPSAVARDETPAVAEVDAAPATAAALEEAPAAEMDAAPAAAALQEAPAAEMDAAPAAAALQEAPAAEMDAAPAAAALHEAPAAEMDAAPAAAAAALDMAPVATPEGAPAADLVDVDKTATPPPKRKRQQTLLDWCREAQSSMKHRKADVVDCDA